MFKEPVEVLPNVNYTACATLKVRRPTRPWSPSPGHTPSRLGALNPIRDPHLDPGPQTPPRTPAPPRS